jgi:primosomal protein N'
VQGRTEARVETASQELIRRMRAALGRRRVTLLGPAPHRIATIRRTVRWRLVLVAAAVEPVIACVRRVIGQSRRIGGLPVLIDVDPL